MFVNSKKTSQNYYKTLTRISRYGRINFVKGQYIVFNSGICETLYLSVLICKNVSHQERIEKRKTAEGKAMSFERGSTVLCRDFGEGIIINLPIHNKIVVRFPDGIVRYFWPDDVASGAIQAVKEKNTGKNVAQ